MANNQNDIIDPLINYDDNNNNPEQKQNENQNQNQNNNQNQIQHQNQNPNQLQLNNINNNQLLPLLLQQIAQQQQQFTQQQQHQNKLTEMIYQLQNNKNQTNNHNNDTNHNNNNNNDTNWSKKYTNIDQESDYRLFDYWNNNDRSGAPVCDIIKFQTKTKGGKKTDIPTINGIPKYLTMALESNQRIKDKLLQSQQRFYYFYLGNGDFF